MFNGTLKNGTQRWAALALLACLIIGMTGAPRVSNAQAATPTATSTPFLRDFVVYLAAVPRAGTLDTATTIRTALNATNFPGYRVTVQAPPRAVTTRQQALDTVKANPAAIAIFWSESVSGGTPALNIELPRRFEFESYTPSLRRNLTMQGYLAYLDSVQIPLDAKFDAATLTSLTQLEAYLAATDYTRAGQAFGKVQTALAANADLSANQAVQDQITFAEAYLNGLFGQSQIAIEAFQRLSQGDGSPAFKAMAAANQGALLISAGDIQGALTALDEAVTLDDTSVHALSMRGVANFLNQQESAALDDLDAGLKLDEQNVIMLNNRGYLQYRAGQSQEAFNDITAAIAIDPRFTSAYVNLSVVLRGAGATRQAINAISQAIALDPLYAVPYAIRGSLLIRSGQYEAAITDLDKAISLDPGDSTSIDNRGFVYETLGNLDKAMADYTRAIEIDPDTDFNYVDRGRIYLKRSQFQLAVLDFSLAIQLGGRRPYAPSYFYRAQAYQGMGDYGNAIKDYNEYIRLDGQGQFANIAKQSITVLRSFITATPSPTRTPAPTRATATPNISRTPTATTVQPTATATLVPSTAPSATLSESQIIGTSVGATVTVQARNTVIAATINALATSNAPTATPMPPTATRVPPTATATPPPPTATTKPASATPTLTATDTRPAPVPTRVVPSATSSAASPTP